MTIHPRPIRILVYSLALSVPAAVASVRSAPRDPRAHEDQRQSGRAGQKRAESSGAGRFTPADNGKAVHDNLLRVTWLLDANVGRSECRSVPNVGPGGAMDWATAWSCIAQLNGGNGLLGHTNWQMPATPMVDRTCKAVGPQGNSFADNCSGSGLGSLFYEAFQRHFGETVAEQVGPTMGGFRNLQPTLYWDGNSLQQQSGKAKRNPDNGYNSFSFSNGWQGANVNHHVMYVLPMIPGPVPSGSAAAKATIWDPAADSGVPGRAGVSWLADANAAADPKFLLEIKASSLQIRKDGAMEQGTAQELIALMRAAKYLGRDDWSLPVASPANCTANGKTDIAFGYHCTVSALGHLYYDVLKLKPGTAVAAPPDIAQAAPFNNVQPSLYWSCVAANSSPAPGAASSVCATPPLAAAGMGFSFDMGTGFTDTTVLASALYVMVYYSDRR